MKLIDVQPTAWEGITDEYWLRPDGKVTVRRVQDVEPILIANKQELNARSAKSSKLNEGEGLGTKVASIPNTLADKVLQDTGLNLVTCDMKTLNEFVNNPTYNKIRTAHGRV